MLRASFFINLFEHIMRIGFNKRMIPICQKICNTTGCPNIAFERVFLHFELLR